MMGYPLVKRLVELMAEIGVVERDDLNVDEMGAQSVETRACTTFVLMVYELASNLVVLLVA